jgi:hypothetical protein
MHIDGDLSSSPKTAPRNNGRLTDQKRALKPKDVCAIRVRLQMQRRRRELALFNLAIDSKLTGCDLVRLQANDVCVGDQVRDRTNVIQKKTGRSVQFEIAEQTRAAIREWLPGGTGNISSQSLPGQPHLSTRQTFANTSWPAQTVSASNVCGASIPQIDATLTLCDRIR